MANKIRRIKSGMGGSSSGRGRTRKTAIMKEHSKTERRRQQAQLTQEGLAETPGNPNPKNRSRRSPRSSTG